MQDLVNNTRLIEGMNARSGSASSLPIPPGNAVARLGEYIHAAVDASTRSGESAQVGIYVGFGGRLGVIHTASGHSAVRTVLHHLRTFIHAPQAHAPDPAADAAKF